MTRWSRRDFFAWTAATAAMAKSSVSFALDQIPPASASNPGFSILQGYTDHESTYINVVAKASEVLEFSVQGGYWEPRIQMVRTDRASSENCVYQLWIRDLVLGQEYTFSIKGPSGNLLDQRTFAALDLGPRRVRLGFVSCAMDHLHRADIWQELNRARPDLIFFLGDNVYADRRSLAEKVTLVEPDFLWERYVQTRERVAFYYLPRLTPVLAIWDDHDFGGNNVNSTYPFKAESKEIFETFFPQPDAQFMETGPGIARRFSGFGAEFFLLDGRTFRSSPGSPSGTMFGQEQTTWLAGQLQPKPSWLMNGSLFYGAYGDFESFEGDFPDDFARFKTLLRRSGATPAFVSGDVHYSEVMRIESEQLGFESFELVSSSIHSMTFPGHHLRFNNPRRQVADSAHNFMIWEGEFTDQSIQGEVVSYGADFELFRSITRAGLIIGT
ncbi:MAG: alkaline phosphatase D family protein [Bdellovibrionales bacterium]